MVWPLPYCPELYMTEFKSEIADMKNSVACRANAQVSCAASFIHEHLPKNYEAKWLHIDMASPVAFGARATGYGVGLLSAIIWNPVSSLDLKSVVCWCRRRKK